MKQKKLTIKKMTVSNLNVETLARVKGGLLWTDYRVCDTIDDTCLINSMPIVCDPER